MSIWADYSSLYFPKYDQEIPQSYITREPERHKTYVCGISEHLIFHHNLHFLDSINSNHVGFGVTDKIVIEKNEYDQQIPTTHGPAEH